MTDTFNLQPTDRELWYHFRGVDANNGAEAEASPNFGLDEYHVRAWFTDNPGDAYVLAVRAQCLGNDIQDGGRYYVSSTVFEDVLDVREQRDGVLFGEAPCYLSTPVTDLDPCSDSSSDYYVRIERADPTDPTCVTGSIELSNAVYPSNP